jgi:hypothetical protein
MIKMHEFTVHGRISWGAAWECALPKIILHHPQIISHPTQSNLDPPQKKAHWDK